MNFNSCLTPSPRITSAVDRHKGGANDLPMRLTSFKFRVEVELASWRGIDVSCRSAVRSVDCVSVTRTSFAAVAFGYSLNGDLGVICWSTSAIRSTTGFFPKDRSRLVSGSFLAQFRIDWIRAEI